jgi:GntR family transcriptional regulator
MKCGVSMLNRDNPVPLYHQLELILKENIEAGVWNENERIPSEHDLSKQYGVSRVTVRAVLTKFVNDGFLYRIQGKGTYVSAPKIVTSNVSYTGIREQLEILGFNTTTKVIQICEVHASTSVRKKLNLNSDDDKVIFIERVRFVNDIPFSLHRSYLPTFIGASIQEEQLVNEQLCVILSRDYGYNRTRVVETLESTIGDSYETSLLEVNNNHPLLLLEDIIYSSTGVAFEYSKVLFRGDKMKMKFEYNNQ